MIKWHNRDGACGRPFSVQKGGFMADYLIEVAGGALWQWDTGRKIKIQTWENRSVTEAHFSIVGSDQALVLDVYEENGEMFSNIPNILLQQEEKIRIYLVDNNRTVGDHTESIIPRTKPDDYVYTETEIKNYEALEKKIPTKMSQLENDIELGGKTFIINVKINTKPASADKTYDEINNAYKSGRHLICVDNNDRVYQLYAVDSCFSFWTALSGDITQKVISIEIYKNKVFVYQRYTNDYYLPKGGMSEYTPTTDYSPATKLYVDTVSKKTVEEHFSKDVDIVPLGQYFINSSYGTTISGKFKMPIVGCEYQITYGDIQTRKVATNHSGNVRIGDNYGQEFIIDFISESKIIVTSAKTGTQTIHITGKTLKPTKPLVLYADVAEDYKNDTTIGDEALEAILDGRQILVRTPNADGGNYTAIFSPILTYQLPNYANEYLYLFYLRDEKQNIDCSAMGLGVIPMPIYGELKLKLSQEYNECPLI